MGVGSFSINGGGGGGGAEYLGMGVLPKVHIRMRAHTCTCMNTHVLNIHTPMHACMHTDVCMHAQPMQTYILLPDMKIIKFKASYLYEKTVTNIYK